MAPPGPYDIAGLSGDLLAVLDELGIGRASFMGLLAGRHGLDVGGRPPPRTSRPSRPVLHSRPSCRHHKAGPSKHRPGAVLGAGFGSLSATLGRWFTASYPEAHPGVEAMVSDMLNQASPEGYAGCCEAIGAMDQWPDMARIVAADADHRRCRRPGHPS